MHVLDPLSLNYRIKCFLMILQNSWKLYYDAHSDIGTKKKHDRKEIGYFHNVFKLMDVSSAKAYIVISHFIHLLLSMWFLLLVSTLHTLVVARLGKLLQALLSLRTTLC